MELTERETLIKVEQKLHNSIENQAQIVEDMREIFNRIDQESKCLVSLKGDLQTHLQTSAVQRENCTTRMQGNSKDLERLLLKVADIEDKYELRFKEIGDLLKKEENSRENLEKNFEIFKESINTTIRNFKLLVTIVGTIMGIFTPYITLVLKDILGK